MRQLRRATLALPVILIAIGLAVPAVVGGGGSRPPAATSGQKARYAGKTASEWHALAMASLEGEEFMLALRYLKTAEKVERGSQYTSDLARARRARKRARAVASNRERMLGGEPEGLELDERGHVLSVHRETVALPGESLWSLAVLLAAARDGVPPSDVDDRDRDVYVAWDALTELNGVRELEVGEVLMVPLSDSEIRSISLQNSEDVGRMRLAAAALDSGRVARAQRLRDEITGRFALESEALELLDRRIRQSRVRQLLASARTIVDEAPSISRPSGHSELVRSLRRARDMLEEAGALAGHVPEPDIELVDALLAEAERFSLKEDGTIAATKPPGVAYTQFAKATVEWFLRRELARSGVEYPYHERKTADEIAWAEYMLEASALAGGGGADFAELLVDEAARPVRLPNPGSYFEERIGEK